MTKQNNMELWNNVCTSDEKTLKSVTYGRSFKAINAQSQIQSATEQFGAFGKGWGIDDEHFDYISIPDVVLYTAKLWWSDKDGKYYIPLHSSTELKSSKGRYDNDCQKKTATDAMTKGLSKLGFNADVFLGLWDDNKYVSKQREIEKQKNQKNTIRKPAPKKAPPKTATPVLEEDFTDF